MVRVETQYFNINRILLLIVGLWPYQQSKLVQVQYTFLSGIVIVAGIFQFTTFMTLRCTPELIIKILSTALFFPIFVILYYSFHINMETVKNLLKELQYIYDEIKEENEIAIIEKYSCHAKRFTYVLIILVLSAIPAFVIMQLWPDILDVIVPINVSRPRRLVIVTEYFVDQDKYFYFILLHINLANFVGGFSMIAIGTTFVGYLKHTCGMFTIASYRIEHAMGIDMLQNISLNDEVLILKKIICAIDIHRQAMKLSTLLISAFETSFFCLILLGVIALSINLFRIFQIISSGGDVKELLLPSTYAIIVILYMFLANYIGQELMDHNKHVFATAYDIQWYIAPLHIQKLILFLLQKSIKEFTLTIGGLFIASMECFASLMNASVSYFTIIYSTR